MLKCAWCNSSNVAVPGKKYISNDILKCPDCDGVNALVSIPMDMDETGLATVQRPTAWCPTNEGLPAEKQPKFWKTAAQGQRELNNLLSGRKKR